MAQHFTTSRHPVNDAEVEVIKELGGTDPVLRKTRESKGTRTLDTACPTGMNLRGDHLTIAAVILLITVLLFHKHLAL